MKRLAMGAALGGFAVYLLDPELGEGRRERLLSHWRGTGAARYKLVGPPLRRLSLRGHWLAA
jgi:hypothetical protein